MTYPITYLIPNVENGNMPVYEEGIIGYPPNCDEYYKSTINNLDIGELIRYDYNLGKEFMNFGRISVELYHIPFYKFDSQLDVWCKPKQ